MYEERLGTFEDDKLDENRVDEIIKSIKQSALNSDRLCRPEFLANLVKDINLVDLNYPT